MPGPSLLFVSSLHQFLHLCRDGFLLTLWHLQLYGNCNIAGFFQNAVTIGEFHFFPGKDMAITISVHNLHLYANLADLAAIGTGIHIHTAANGAGNAVSKFQTAEIMVCGKDRRTGHGNTCHHTQAIVIENFNCNEPVCVDILTGVVYELPHRKLGKSFKFKNTPYYDSPIVICDRSLIGVEMRAER